MMVLMTVEMLKIPAFFYAHNTCEEATFIAGEPGGADVPNLCIDLDILFRTCNYSPRGMTMQQVLCSVLQQGFLLHPILWACLNSLQQ